MKNLLTLILGLIILTSCSDENPSQVCSTPATLRDLTGLDGCSWVFELEDGKQLVAMHAVMFCGTPPLPKEVTDDPLYNFEWENGKTVYINYAEVEAGSSCMVGPLVKINCISDRIVETGE